MKWSKFTGVFFIAIISVFSNLLSAAECPAVFPDVISTHGVNANTSRITFGKAAQVKNNPDTELSTLAIQADVTPLFPTCDSAECSITNNSAATSNPGFDNNTSLQDVNIVDGGDVTFGLNNVNEYRDVYVNIIDPDADPKPTPTFATLNFGDDYDTYHFDSFNLGVNTTLNLAAGKSYFFREMIIQEATTINVVGDGTAIVYIQDVITFPADTQINSPIKASGDVTKLVMHVDDHLLFKSGVTFSGALYAKDITFTSASFLYGVAAGEKVALEEGSILTYDDDVFTADFGRVCGPEIHIAAPVANFKFDEKEYADVAGEVKDSIGAFHSRAKSAQTVEGKVCQALDLSATGINDYVVLDKDVLDGKREFSISVWAKTSKTGHQSFLSGATSGSNNELIMWFTGDTRFAPHLQNRNNGILSVSSIAGNTWRHLVWTHGNNKSCLFIDKVAQGCIDQPTSTLDITSLIVGQEQDSVGGGFAPSQSYNGLLDELVIYEQVIEQDQIDQIYDYQNHGLDLDGEPISCLTDPIIQYSMDELSWDGSVGEVLDETGNFNSQALNGLTTGNSTPALTGNPGTCRYGDFDGINDYIQINDNAKLDLQKELSISVWINPKSLPNSGLKTIVSKDENYEFHLTPAGEINWWWQRHSFSTSGAGITAGNWYHIAITYESGKQAIYINGVEKGARTFTEDLILNNDPLQIGQDQGISSRFFQGFIDEVYLFDTALSAGEINSLYNKRHACAEPVIHHYEIVHDGNGLTCALEPITIKACTNSRCSSNGDLSSESVSLDFTVTSLTDGNIIKASPTFTGSTSFTFNHSVAEALILSIKGATVTASNAIECSGGSCNMTFADAGFRFLSGDENNETIAHQTSGRGFVDTLKLQAVKSNDGVCEGLFSGDVTISLAQENVTPERDFNPGLAFQSNDNNVAKYPDFTDDVTLDFGSDSIAVIDDPKYLDAGKIRLHAKYANDKITIVGSSNEFWVKPDKFVIDSPASYGTATDSTFVAGKDFIFTVSALNSKGFITENYRQSDGELQLKVSGITSIPTNTVNGRFTYADNSDIESNIGFQFVTLVNFSDGDKGKSVFNAGQYNEVGIINVDIQDSKYGDLVGDAGLVSADSLTMGRFIPAYFKQTVNTSGNLDAYHSRAELEACTIKDWAYTGQRTADNKGTIGYSLVPKIAITAFNAQDEITENYTLGVAEGFMRLLATGIDITEPSDDDEQLRVGNIADNFAKVISFMEVGQLGTSVNDEGGLIAGQMLYTFSENDHFSYDRDDSSFLKPFWAQIPFVTEQITDQDGVTLQTENESNEIAEDAIEKLVITGVNVRFARMVVANAYGSENARLRSPLSIEVYDGINFAITTDESCLTASINDKKPGAKYSGNMNTWDYRLIDIDTDNIQISDTEASVSGIFEKGIQNQLFFSSPGLQGTLEWEYEVPDWFKFKWDSIDGSADGNFYDDNPSATLSFGLYRGNDRIISWREISN
ncbi:LamG domain-containing protein [Colwellia sp. Arc7-635]|uniref:LamG domain-containing protein n=1 Tax=Colwellia sp. Arc7-635 TaxID=2497879 RepID=UPI000F85306D|nr:LamG domain-containing protein [Colwellia sp. Arc7-635]AZQ85762.1 LamG domain-containing protein [Colwellia sp. Arc7-635]